MNNESLRERIHEIIFEADTKWGKFFDVSLLWSILVSLLIVTLESIKAVELKISFALNFFEWLFTILFTIEYALRVYSVRKPRKYIFSPLGLVDLIAIIPSYLSLVIAGSEYLLVIRAIRLLRVFRIFKLSRHLSEARTLTRALRASRDKITVFLAAIISMVTIMGSIMYLVEGEENGFTSIPRGMYWAVVTMTTVGYGDIAPKTILGQLISSVVMILGYAIIAIPTGIVTAELSQLTKESINTRTCRSCSHEGHDPDADYCKFCGEELD